jgi:tetratricopeptide (TPR) repeat protein
LGQGFLIAGIGYFAGLLFWPFALQDVFRNPLESLTVMEHYKVSIRQIFDGSLFWSTQLPWYYLPKWILISTPEFVLFGFLLGFIPLIRCILKPTKNKQLFLELFVFFTLFFPIFYVIIINSNLYSGVRQLFFVFPIIAIISSLGIIRLWNSNWNKFAKIPVLGLFFVLMIFPVKNQAKTFPADYIYFNEVSGGAKKAWSNFEYDYYFHGIKKSSEYLLNVAGAEDIIVASNCNLSNYFENRTNVTFQYARYLERSSVDWDYGLFGVNYIHPYQLKNKTWQSSQIIKTFYHHGNPIVVLLKRTDKNDFIGIRELEEGNYEKGELLVRQALKSDPNNVWLFVHLAKNCFKRKEFGNFEELIKNGLALHNYYEPLYLLNAQRFYNEGEYVKSLETLERLKWINPRYKNAAPLIKAVNEKLNK